jgi:hypothetical protein
MSDKKDQKKEYKFGGIKEFNLEEIESEVLNDSVYLDVFAGSDRMFKEDVRALENSLSKIQELDGVTYNYKVNEFPDYAFSKERQVGFIAQAVERVLPELVMKDENGYLKVNYAHMTPVLLEGIKELSGIVERQDRQIKELTARLNRLSPPAKEQEETEEKRPS